MGNAGMESMRSPWTVIHSAEIVSRDFPRTRKGFDPDAVRAWLRTVAATVESLQRELDHVRAERDRMEATLRRAGEEPASSAVRSALLDARLRRRHRGYDRTEVESLLESAAAEIARLETRTAVLEAEAATRRETAAHEEHLARTIARMESELSSLRTQVSSIAAAESEPALQVTVTQSQPTTPVTVSLSELAGGSR